MKNPKKSLLLTFLLLISAKTLFCQLSVIPHPAQVEIKPGYFNLGEETMIIYSNSIVYPILEETMNKWGKLMGIRLKIVNDSTANKTGNIFISLIEKYDSIIGNEGYRLFISSTSVNLSSNTAAGVRYGLETIGQLLETDKETILPCADIIDYPRFTYRGLHLDVSRHFHPLEFIYKAIDFLVMHKMNTFHWHLNDDQGWRLEIKKYPKLTEIGAWRENTNDITWRLRPYTTDHSKATYGGFYTQDEVKKVVSYAAERNITIIPEIEMPAHAMAALEAYPEYSCTGKNAGIPTGNVWPITHIYCAGKEETFHFLEDVLTEVMELFPSTYIHIGGDEADKANWKTCKFCQERIKREGLKNEEELQSYFTKRIEKFLNAHGRQIIGWDEILEGGISPNATVMSWRGVQGGIEAAKMVHHAIMTPGGYCYFDYYQGDPSIEPTAIGGYTTLKQVYNFEPIPSELTIEEGKFILGAQANLWSEYILDYHHAEYMLFPRLSALSEVLWSPKDKRDWGSFSKRMEEQYQRYERRDINYSLSAFQVKAHAEPDPVNRQLLITLNSEAYEPEIRYTFNGSEPDINSTLYTEPFPISTTTQLKATVFKNGVSMKQVLTEFYDLHNAFMANLTLQKEPSPRYPGSGKYTLVDGKIGTTSFTDGLWLGFSGDDMIAIIDLYKTTKITSTELYALQTEASWIFPPQWVSFETSKDGQNFVLQETVQKPKNIGKADKNILCYSTDKSVDDIRYIRVTAKNFGVCPPGHSGEGNPAWLFVSEIKIK